MKIWRLRGKKRYLAIASLLTICMIIVSTLVGHYAWRHGRAFVNESLQAVALLKTSAASLAASSSEGGKRAGAQDREAIVATLAQTRQHLVSARQALHALEPLVNPIVSLAPTLSQVPGLREPLQDALALWRFAYASNHLAEEGLLMADLVVTSLDGPATPATIETLLSTLPHMSPYLDKIEQQFSQAQAARRDLSDFSWLPAPLASKSQSYLARWDNAVPLVEQMLPLGKSAINSLPTLLGKQEAKTYLILIQTQDELRATGGFITGVGTIEVEKGEIIAFNVGKVTDAEPEGAWWQLHKEVSGTWIQPPQPLSQYMGLGHWAFRDVNFMADFPTTAQQAARFWKAHKGSEPDGVIAIGEQGLQAILEGLGSVELANGEQINAQNLKETTLAYVYQGDKDEWRKRQGEFSRQLASTFLDAVKHSWADHLPQLVQPLIAALTRGDILISSFDPNVAEVLNELGYDGALQSPPGDYLYLVEQNVSYNKLSQFIEQKLDYTVTIDDNAHPIESTLIIDEANTYQPGAGWSSYPKTYYVGGRWNPKARNLDIWEGYYGGYSTLYLPLDAHVLQVSGFDDKPVTLKEEAHTMIGGYVGLWSQDQQRLKYHWQHGSDSQLSEGEYQLFIQHQPGAPAHEVTVHVQLPIGYRATQITPAPAKVDGQSVTWQIVLYQNQQLALRLESNALLAQSTDANRTEANRTEANVTEANKTEANVTEANVTEANVTETNVTEANTTESNTTETEMVTPMPTSTMTPPLNPTVNLRPLLPQQVIIPAIEVDAEIIPVGLEPSGIMASPDDSQLVGWYNLAARPGEASNAVLAGHLDWKGEIGVFNRLDDLQRGDILDVYSQDGASYRYMVETIEVYDVNSAPVADIFGATTEPQLTLITCTGSYDSQQQIYQERLVIRARGVWTDPPKDNDSERSPTNQTTSIRN